MTEIEKLQNWLEKNHIQYEKRVVYDGDQILIETPKVKLSFVCHSFSYGREQGLIEMWDFKNDPKGWLTAEACKRIIKRRAL